ncbi:MAG: hypothetical protein JOZ07_14090 [Solirubrobacterales bacterium]|nr:hypothetical protein [Solirubrobacterales bacterium]
MSEGDERPPAASYLLGSKGRCTEAAEQANVPPDRTAADRLAGLAGLAKDDDEPEHPTIVREHRGKQASARPCAALARRRAEQDLEGPAAASSVAATPAGA